MASYYRPGHPAVLRAIKRISDACLASGKELSVCGEMAHDPDFIEFFVGLGITKLSLDPRQLYATQRIIATIDSTAAREHAAAMLKG